MGRTGSPGGGHALLGEARLSMGRTGSVWGGEALWWEDRLCLGRRGSPGGGQALQGAARLSMWRGRLSMGGTGSLGDGQTLYGEDRLSAGGTGSLWGGEALYREDRLSRGEQALWGWPGSPCEGQALRVEDRLSGGRGRHLERSGTPGVAGCRVILHRLTQVPAPRCAPPHTPPRSSVPLLALWVGGHHFPYRPGQRPSGVSGSDARKPGGELRSVGVLGALHLCPGQSLAKAAGVQAPGGVEGAGDTQDQLWS